jgi:hypothetical protein
LCGAGGERRIFGLFSLIEGFRWGIIRASFSAFKAMKGGWGARHLNWYRPYLKAACEHISQGAKVENIGDFLEEQDVYQGRW